MTEQAAKRKSWVEALIHSIHSRRLSLPAAWRDSLLIFTAGRLFYSLIGFLVWWTKYRPAYADRYYYEITPLLNGWGGALLGVWQRWDGIHYQRIALSGYADPQLSLFYPLYPVASRWLAELTHLNLLAAFLLVSNLAFLLSMVLVHKIVSQYYSVQVARGTIAALVLFPSSFYFYAIFPQSLLLFFILLSYYCVRRGWWVAAAVSGFFAGLTHSTAIALTFLVGVEAIQFLWPQVIALRERRFVFRWKYVIVLLAPITNVLGIGVFMLWRNLAGFPSYVELQSTAYAKALSLPWDGVEAIIQSMISPSNQANPIMAWTNTAVLLLIAILLIWSFRRIPWSWWVMQLGFLIFITTNHNAGNPLISFFRYCLIVFPLFVEISLLGQRPGWRLLKFGLGLFLAILFSAMFFMWQYDLA